MKQEQPRILVISHNCFSEVTANGRTLSSFFRLWDKDKVAQLYINDEYPESNICNTFFRITDKEILKSIFSFSKEAGFIIENKLDREITSLNLQNKDNTIYKFKILKYKFPSIIYLLRNLLWKTNKWDHNNLNNWINEFKPDLILLQPGDYSFLYKIARVLSKRKNVPLVVYNSEDYFLKDKFSVSPFFILQRYFFKQEVLKTYNFSKLVIYSNDLLEKNLHKYFNTKSDVILTSSEIKPTKINKIDNNIKIVYAGNLGHDRWKSLVSIGETIKKINDKLEIEVYSGFLPDKALKYFTPKNGINYKGAVSYNKVVQIINESDIVIHVEGFSNFTKLDIKHGFSTKIADLLSSGKCFFMYGPKGIACVDYLINNQAAWVATNDDELIETLDKILNNKNERFKYIQKANELVEERHDLNKNCQIFQNLILEIKH